MLNWILIVYLFLGAFYLANKHQPTMQRHLAQIMLWPLWLCWDLFDLFRARLSKRS